MKSCSVFWARTPTTATRQQARCWGTSPKWPELTSLETELHSARAGRGRPALVEAESGGGKTRLLEEIAEHSAQQGAWVVRGQGLDQAAQRPFQVLDGIVSA